jgi:hydrogenase maturation protease
MFRENVASKLRPAHSAPKIVVLGVGNEFRGDDGAGPFIIGRLEAENLPDTLVELRRCGPASLIDQWRDAETAIVVDAAAGSSPGKIHRFEVSGRSIPEGVFIVSTHSLGVAESVELARSLNLLPLRLLIYGIEGRRFDHGAGLSPEVEKAACEVAELVMREIENQHFAAENKS